MEEINKSLRLSSETKRTLEDETLNNIQTVTNLVVSLRNSIKMLNTTKELLEPQNSISLSEREKTDEIYYLNRLSEYALLIGLIWLDITTAYRVYINAKENYETIYSIKQLIITINEGFKRIYHYIIEKNGSQQLKNRNQSFWVRDIGNLVDKELPFLVSEYNKITEDLDSYIDEDMKKIKEQRDFCVHYDEKDASKVYDILVSLDMESMTIKAIPFMNILSKMFLFSITLLNEYKDLINKRKDITFNSHYEKLEQLKLNYANNPQVTRMLNDIKKQIKEFQAK